MECKHSLFFLQYFTDEPDRFQWVVCQLDMLKRCLSVAAVRKALEEGLPKDLNQTYDQILARIDDQHLPEVMKILKALIATESVLFLDEIVEILAVDFEQMPPRFEQDLRIMDPRSILSMYAFQLFGHLAILRGERASVLVTQRDHTNAD